MLWLFLQSYNFRKHFLSSVAVLDSTNTITRNKLIPNNGSAVVNVLGYERFGTRVRIPATGVRSFFHASKMEEKQRYPISDIYTRSRTYLSRPPHTSIRFPHLSRPIHLTSLYIFTFVWNLTNIMAIALVDGIDIYVGDERTSGPFLLEFLGRSPIL